MNDTHVPVTATLQATKTISGRTFKDGDSFTFSVSELTDQPAGTYDGVTMPKSTSVSTTATSGTSQTVSFDGITFTKAGTYTFNIAETVGNADGITYDTSVHTAKVVVSADKNNSLTTSVTYDGDTSTTAPAFTNIASTKVTISKVDVASGSEIAGAKLTVTGKTVEGKGFSEAWTSEAGKSHIVSVPAGTYTLTEVTAPTGYDVAESITFTVGTDGTVTSGTDGAVSGTIVTMKDASTTTKKTVTKTWMDNNNQDAARPESVTMHLLANGTDTGATLILDDKNDWKGSFTNLPTTLDGATINYTVTEDAVAGYSASVVDDSESADGNTFSVTNTHTPGTTNFTATKVWADNNDQAGLRPTSVTLKLQKTVDGVTSDVDSSEATVTSDANWQYTWSNLPAKENGKAITYSVAETSSDVNYAAKAAGNTVTNTVNTHKVAISKVDVANGSAELAGAQLTITNARGAKVEQWTSGADKHEVELPAGTYTLTEVTAPNGYDKAESIAFTVDAKGNVTSGTEGAVSGTKVTMKDTLTTHDVTVSKVSATEGAPEVSGAELSVIDSKGTTVDSWTSEAGTDHQVKLPAGTYTLHESQSKAEGFAYDLATDVTFTVDNSGNVTSTTAGAASGAKVTMTDKLTGHDVTISKVDVASGSEIAGAELTVAGKTVEGKGFSEAWTSEAGKSHKLTVPAGTYTLTEVTAPNGYDVAESIAFTVDAKGTVTSTTEGAVSGTKVTMKDAATTTSVDVIKVWDDSNDRDAARPQSVTMHLLANGTDMGATLTLDEKNDWKASFTNLPTTLDGTTISYTVSEDVPTDYVSTVTGSAAAGFTVTNTIQVHDPEVSKVDATSKAELPGAKLTITNSRGGVVDSWTSDTTVHVIPLAPGTYTLTEVTAPDGYEKAESITFSVAHDGTVTSTTAGAASGTRITMEDARSTKPSTPTTPTTPTTTTPTTATTPVTPATSTTTENIHQASATTTSLPQTGDTSATGFPFVSALAGAALLCGLAMQLHERRRREE